MALTVNMNTCRVGVNTEQPNAGAVLPHQLVNQSTVFSTLVWQVTTPASRQSLIPQQSTEHFSLAQTDTLPSSNNLPS